MSDTITATLVENTETITATLYDGGDEIIAHINELARGPAGADGGGGEGGGSGTVTSVSVTTANGVSGSVATATTTPAITLTLGAITPTTVNGLTITSNGTNTLNIAAGQTLTVSSGGTIASGSAAYSAASSFAPASGIAPSAVSGTAVVETDARIIALGNVTADGFSSPAQILKTNATGSLTLAGIVLVGDADAIVLNQGPTWSTILDVTNPTTQRTVTVADASGTVVLTNTGEIVFTGPTVNRIKTVRDAADTILELGGSYTPTGTWTSMTLVTPALGTPASGVVTNLTGTASININGTVGATTPSSGAFTTLSATGTFTNPYFKVARNIAILGL